MKTGLVCAFLVLGSGAALAQDVSGSEFTELTDVQAAVFLAGWGLLEKPPFGDAGEITSYSVLTAEQSCDTPVYHLSDWSSQSMRTLVDSLPQIEGLTGSRSFFASESAIYMAQKRDFADPVFYKLEDVGAHQISNSRAAIRYRQGSEWKDGAWVPTNFSPNYLVIDDIQFEGKTVQRSWSSLGPDLASGSFTTYYVRCP